MGDSSALLNCVILREAARGEWLRFGPPVRILTARRIGEVLPALEEVGRLVREDGVHAAGFVAYEAAPAFDSALAAHPARGPFPLLWFGLYREPAVIALPEPDFGAYALGRLRPAVRREDYAAALARIQDYIRSGDTYQVNYTVRGRFQLAPTDLDSTNAATARKANVAPIDPLDYFEFVPRGEIYYKVMAVCDIIVLPSTDETQSGTLARIIALNKPFITTAPMEGLTSQTIESQGGLLFTNKPTLRQNLIRLASDKQLRTTLSQNLRVYLENVVSWPVVARHYAQSYELARQGKTTHQKIELPVEF